MPSDSSPLSIRTPDGATLHAEQKGDRGPVMLLCNGLFCSTHYYGPFVEHFARTHRVVTFDYRGHGKSGPAPDPRAVTIPALVEDARAVLEATSPEPAIVVGHSMGARVALELAASARGRVSSVVMLCGSAYSPLGTGRRAQAFEYLGDVALGATARSGPLAFYLRHALTDPDWMIRAGSLFGGLGPGTPREPVRALVRNVRALDMTLMASLARSYLAHSSRPSLARIDAPVLQLVGERDNLAPPAHAREVERMLPHASTHVLRGCTHLAPIEQPGEVHQLIEAFLG